MERDEQILIWDKKGFLLYPQYFKIKSKQKTILCKTNKKNSWESYIFFPYAKICCCKEKARYQLVGEDLKSLHLTAQNIKQI